MLDPLPPSVILTSWHRLSYTIHTIDMRNNAQKEPWFLEMNPNGRVPALTDTFTDGKQIRLFESGSIMQYLVDRYDTNQLISYPKGSRESYEVNSWLFFQVANIGPMQGQATHFHRYVDQQHPYSESRYKNEVRRLYRVLDTHLSTSPSGYLVGDKCTIADIAHLGWIALADWSGIDAAPFPHLAKWEQKMYTRPGINRGRNVPTPHLAVELSPDKELVDRVTRENRAWVQWQQARDARDIKA